MPSKKLILFISLIFLGCNENSDNNLVLLINKFEKKCFDNKSKECLKISKEIEKRKPSHNLLMTMEKLCLGGSDVNCIYSGWFNYKFKNYDNALVHSERGCTKGFKSSCDVLGKVWELKSNSKKAKAAYRISCDKGSSYGCSELGRLFIQDSNFKMAIEVLEEPCRVRKMGDSCYNLACAESLLGLTEKSLISLRLAIKYGYSDFENIKSDPDLEKLRKSQDISQLFSEQ